MKLKLFLLFFTCSVFISGTVLAKNFHGSIDVLNSQYNEAVNVYGSAKIKSSQFKDLLKIFGSMKAKDSQFADIEVKGSVKVENCDFQIISVSGSFKGESLTFSDATISGSTALESVKSEGTLKALGSLEVKDSQISTVFVDSAKISIHNSHIKKLIVKVTDRTPEIFFYGNTKIDVIEFKSDKKIVVKIQGDEVDVGKIIGDIQE